MTNKIIHYNLTENGIVFSHEEEVEIPTDLLEQDIKNKEEQLLNLYEEIIRLKEAQNNNN